jgi:hypothetical protein
MYCYVISTIEIFHTPTTGNVLFFDTILYTSYHLLFNATMKIADGSY